MVFFSCCKSDNSTTTIKQERKINYYNGLKLNLDDSIKNDREIYIYIKDKLLESIEYIITSKFLELRSNSFIYYFFLYITCTSLLNNYIHVFTHVCQFNDKLADILEVNLFIKYCIYNHIQPRLLDQASMFILKDDKSDGNVFYKPSLFWFIILEERYQDFFEDFFDSYNKISESDFDKIVKYLNVLKLLLI